MAFIYKITNQINNKIYIGYTSNTIQQRFEEHWYGRNSDNSILHKAMIKYGKDAFKIEQVEEISEDIWIEKEQYWIDFYNSKVPNGYNICNGGNKPPTRYGENNVKSKLTTKQFFQLIEDLKKYDLDFGQIASKYNISQSQVERLNRGDFRKLDNEDYPIRKFKKDQYIIKCIIEDLKNNILSQSEIEEKYQIKSRTRLYNINTGKVGRKIFPQEKYPIRPGIQNRKPTYLS